MRVGLYLGRHGGGGGGIGVYAQALLRESLRQIRESTFPSSELLVYTESVIFSPEFRSALDAEGIVFRQTDRGLSFRSSSQQVTVRRLDERFGRKAGLLADQLVLPSQLRRDGVSLVHAVANIGLVKTTTRQLVTVHDLFQAYPPMHESRVPTATQFFFRALFTLQFQREDFYLCDLASVRQELAERYSLPLERIRHIDLGVDETIIAAAQLSQDEAHRRCARRLSQSHNISLPQMFVVLLASSDPRKNTIASLAAWRDYRVANPLSEVGLLVVSQDQAILEHLRANPERDLYPVPRLDRQVFAEVLRAARLLLFVSHNEGFGLPILEALCCKTPVLATSAELIKRYPWYRDFLYLCDPQDGGTITAEITHALADDAAAQALEALGINPRSMREAVQETIATYAEIGNGAYSSALNSPPSAVSRRA